MSSSILPIEEVQVPPKDAVSASKSTEENVTVVISGQVSSDTSSKVGNESHDSLTAATTNVSASLSPSLVVPATTTSPPPPRLLGNGSVQGPLRANFSNNTGITTLAGFSYNIFPRINPPTGAPQHSPMVLGVNSGNRVSPAALQPPVPGQPIVARPSFSYNIVSHASAIPAPGQQFQPATVPSHASVVAHPQGHMLPSQAAIPLSHSTPPIRPLGSNPNVAREDMENCPTSSQSSSSLDKGKLSSSASSVGEDTKPSVAKQNEPLCAASTEGAQMAPNLPKIVQSVASVQSGQMSSSIVVTEGSTNVNHAATSSALSNQFPKVPAAPIFSGMVMPNTSAASGFPSSTVSVGSTAPETSNMIAMPSSAPSNPSSFPAPIVHNIPQQMIQPHPSYPAATPPQPLWLPSHVGAMQRPPFLPYPGPTSAPHPLPMRSIPPITALHPPGVPVVTAPGVSLPGAAVSVPGSGVSMKLTPTDNNKQSGNLAHECDSKKIDEDAWTAHKTDAGVVYYYNSISGESTYEKPANFKVEEDKVTAQPTPISWEKLTGTDWALVTTDDGKKYYYDTKNKVSSWQIPPEVSYMLKNPENAAIGTTNPSQPPTSLNTPALQTGGRDATGLRVPVPGTTVSSSALDLVKRKLQDASAPITSSPLPVCSTLGTSSDSQKIVDVSCQEMENNKDKSRDANGDANISESSSDSEETDGGPTKEECIIKFKEMLKERGVAPFSKWEKELPKIVFDSRFKAVPGYAARRSLFEHYVRNRAEEERKEKKAAQKAAIEAFKCLLDEASEDIDVRTDYSTFKRKWGSDRRFEALDRKEKEMLLNERILSLKKAVEETHAIAASKFKSMLKERSDITYTTRWSRVKDGLRNDPRYKGVNREVRESLFIEYLSEMKAAEDSAEKVEKAKREEQEKLKRREQETRKRKQREEQEMETLRLKVRRKEAEASFQALLVETIKDPKASWTESKPKLEKDPQGRFTNSGLELADMEKLFRDHVKILFERCMNDFRALLNDVITVEAASKVDDNSILTSWSEAKALLKPDVRYAKVPSKERESLWRKHADEMLRKQKYAQNPTRSDAEGKGKSSLEKVGRSPRSHRRR